MRLMLIAATVAVALWSQASAAEKLDRYDGADAGTLLFSVASQVKYWIGIDRVDQPARLSISGDPTDKPAFYVDRLSIKPQYERSNDESTPGYVFALKLPPGRYKLSYLNVEKKGIALLLSQDRPAGDVFQIDTGATTYIGAMQWALEWGPGGLLPGREGVGVEGWRLRTTNRLDRDVAAIPRYTAGASVPTPVSVRLPDPASEDEGPGWRWAAPPCGKC